MDFGNHPRVFCSARQWELSGVNVFAANLIRGLCARGFDARMIIPKQSPSATGWEVMPSDLPITPLRTRRTDRGVVRWRMISRVLKKNAPCVYLPGFDWFCAWKSLNLRPLVRVLGVLHSDETCYYNLASILGHRMDGVVAVTDAITEQAVRCQPELTGRIETIPYGVHCPDQSPKRDSNADEPLSIVYAGRLSQYQKRVFDIPSILRHLDQLNVPFTLTIVGDGKEAHKLTRDLAPWVSTGKTVMQPALTNAQTLSLFAKTDVFLLTSDFEGLPVALLEAMSRGCVPVVSATRSGAPQLVDNGTNGFLVPIGEIHTFAERIADLHHDRNLLSRLSQQTFATIRSGQYLLDHMCDRYSQLITRMMSAESTHHLRTPAVSMSVMRRLHVSYRDYIPRYLLPLLGVRKAIVEALPMGVRLPLRHLRESYRRNQSAPSGTGRTPPHLS